MKIKKIAAGMAAATIAATMMALPTSAANKTYKAGIFFQTSEWCYRDSVKDPTDIKDEAKKSTFPSAGVGCYGDGGIDTKAQFSDVTLAGDGVYTVSLNKCSGKVTAQAKKNDDGTTTMGSVWGLNNKGCTFKMLGIATNMVCTENDDGDYANEDGSAHVGSKNIKVTNATVTIGSKSYTSKNLKAKSDNEWATFCAINEYNDEAADKTYIGTTAKNITMPSENQKIVIKFTVSGMGYKKASSSSSNSNKGTNSGSNSNSSTNNTSNNTNGSTNNTNNSNSSVNGTSSNKTSANTGVAANLALAGIALAGATLVITKKK